MIKKISICLVLSYSALCLSQNQQTYKSAVVETDRLKVEYMDYGGNGKPLIVVQGAHNYFDESASDPYCSMKKPVGEIYSEVLLKIITWWHL